MTAQNRIYEIQNIYKEWLSLQERLQIAKQDLIKSIQLISQLENFYFEGEFRTIFEQIENGESFDLTTQGEYSIMSEDTLWNAFHDQQTSLWAFLRVCVEALDKKYDE